MQFVGSKFLIMLELKGTRFAVLSRIVDQRHNSVLLQRQTKSWQITVKNKQMEENRKVIPLLLNYTPRGLLKRKK